MRARGTPIICAACGTRRSRRRTGLEVRHFYRKKVVMVDCRIVTVGPRREGRSHGTAVFLRNPTCREIG